MIIKLADFIGYISPESKIYIRLLGQGISLSLARFIRNNVNWDSYEVLYVQTDNNDIILNVGKSP